MKPALADRFSLSWQDIALPLVLVATGSILVGGDWLGWLSLDRIADYWPFGVILVSLANMTDFEAVKTKDQRVGHAR